MGQSFSKRVFPSNSPSNPPTHSSAPSTPCPTPDVSPELLTLYRLHTLRSFSALAKDNPSLDIAKAIGPQEMEKVELYARSSPEMFNVMSPKNIMIVRRDIENWILKLSENKVQLYDAGTIKFSSSASIQQYIDGPFQELPDNVLINLNLEETRPGGGFTSGPVTSMKPELLTQLREKKQFFLALETNPAGATVENFLSFKNFSMNDVFQIILFTLLILLLMKYLRGKK